MYEKINKFNFFIVILFFVCFLAGCTGSFFFGISFNKSGNTDYSGRDYEYSRQMGRASELLESVDNRIGIVQDGLTKIAVDLGEDTGDLRRFAQRLRVIAADVEKMENDIAGVRSDISDFRRNYSFDTDD